MELQKLPVDSWLKKEISEFTCEYDTCGEHAPSTLDEALDCFGLVALGADVTKIDSAAVGRLCVCAMELVADETHYKAWQKKQSDRGREEVTKSEIERAVGLVVNRSPILLLVNLIFNVKQITQYQNGN